MTKLIDEDITREQFEALDPDTAEMLADALQADFAEWGEKLLAAARANDPQALSQARHALKGLCGNFGASALEKALGEPLDSDIARTALSAMLSATVAAILAVAG